MNFDLQLFYSINGWAGRNAIADGIGIFFARDLIVFETFIVFLILLWMTSRGQLERARRMLLLIVVSVVIAFAASVAIGLARERPRPYVVQPVTRQLVGYPGLDRSFPSGHATIAFALAFATAFALPAWTIPMILIALLVGFGRVFVGVHYPFDVVGGAMLSLIVTYALSRYHGWGSR